LKTLLLILSLLLITTNAYAEWILYSQTKNGVNSDVDIFYDPLTVKRNGDKVKVWKYTNFSPNDEKAKSLEMASARSLVEIDCVNQTSKQLAFHVFTKQNLEGDMTMDTAPRSTIDYIAPDSTHATLMKLVCKK